MVIFLGALELSDGKAKKKIKFMITSWDRKHNVLNSIMVSYKMFVFPEKLHCGIDRLWQLI